MVVGVGSAALITGGGNGLGRAFSLALAKKGATVTVVEYAERDGQETVRLIEEEHTKLVDKPRGPPAIFIKCDVTVPEQLHKAFALHEKTYGRLDICLNNAGIGETKGFDKDTSNDGKGIWRKTLDVNLSAVIDGTRLAVQMMRRTKVPGVIVNVSSAAGLYPAPLMPIYSASKAGVAMFTRSLRPLKREGIRVNALCPEFVETNLTKAIKQQQVDLVGGFIPMDAVLKGLFELIEDESKAAECLLVTLRKFEYWPSVEERRKYEVSYEQRMKLRSKIGVPPTIPREYRKVIVRKLSSDFRSATQVVTTPLVLPLKPGHVLVKNLYSGVNASDVNFSSGRYFGGKAVLPFDTGFEAIGVVASVGEGVENSGLVPGSPVATLTYGGFSEFAQVHFKKVIRMPVVAPELVAILTSGLTASLALEQAGRMTTKETVLVTAAAGGTGQFAVQLAKLAGNTVIATCGGADKAKLLKSLGVDRVIDYRKEDIKMVLKNEFPKGIDLIYESVGGEMFTTCLNALATRGRIIVIGMISKYQGEKGWLPGNYPGLAEKILAKSQSVVGFFLNDYTRFWREHAAMLSKLYLDKKLTVTVDPKPFLGVNSVADAVEHLHSGRSLGKVIVQMAPEATSTPSSRL